jgi:hypothetical protein
MKYKVGDRVLILETITGIDEDSDYPYIISSDDGQGDEWVYREDEIFALVSPDAFAEEAKPTLKYKMDEFVTDSENMDYGIGKIIEIDENNEYQYHVEFFYINDYCPMKVWKWLKEEKVNPITVHDLVAECNKLAELHKQEKKLKYKVGDKVVVNGLIIWGTGTIIEVNLETSDNRPYIVCYPYFNGGEVKNMKYWVREDDIIYKDE